MDVKARCRLSYCVAAAVGICFGLLIGGAMAFVVHNETPVPTVDWTPPRV
jgi:hypothetical protein